MLEGITVLDLASVGPAARASRWLADYGARVVKVGPPPRQDGVQIVPPFHTYSAHREMQRVLLDLKAGSGRDAFLRLAARADVLIESFRPGVMDRLRLGERHVRAVNPGIVYCSTSGYGSRGPRSQWAGHDLDYLAVGGYLSCTGRDAEGAPALPGATIADAAAGGLHAVASILAALVRRERTGEGAGLDVSVADGVVALMSLAVDEHLATGSRPGPGRDLLTGRYACYGVYRCADGEFVAVAAIEPRFFRNLCEGLGCGEWVEHQTDDTVQAELRRAFARAFARRTRDEWVAVLGPADTCVAPVAGIPEVVRDEHFRARGVFTTIEGGERGAFEQVNRLLAGQRRDTPPGRARGAAETDTDALLRDAGLTDDEIRALREEGVAA